MENLIDKEINVGAVRAQNESSMMYIKQELVENVEENNSEHAMTCTEIAELLSNELEQVLEPKDQRATISCEPEPGRVIPTVDNSETEPAKEEPHTCVLFVNNLNSITTEETLTQHFKTWGNVTEVNLVKVTGCDGVKRSRGYGFVHFSSSSEVELVQANRPHKVDGVKVFTKRALPSLQTCYIPLGTTITSWLNVNHLHKDTTEHDLKTYFEQFGIVVHVDKNRKRNTARVKFSDYDAVDKVVLQQHHKICNHPVFVRKGSRFGLLDFTLTRSSHKFRHPGPNPRRQVFGPRVQRPRSPRVRPEWSVRQEKRKRDLPVVAPPPSHCCQDSVRCMACHSSDKLLIMCLPCLDDEMSLAVTCQKAGRDLYISPRKCNNSLSHSPGANQSPLHTARYIIADKICNSETRRYHKGDRSELNDLGYHGRYDQEKGVAYESHRYHRSVERERYKTLPDTPPYYIDRYRDKSADRHRNYNIPSSSNHSSPYKQKSDCRGRPFEKEKFYHDQERYVTIRRDRSSPEHMQDNTRGNYRRGCETSFGSLERYHINQERQRGHRDRSISREHSSDGRRQRKISSRGRRDGSDDSRNHGDRSDDNVGRYHHDNRSRSRDYRRNSVEDRRGVSKHIEESLSKDHKDKTSVKKSSDSQQKKIKNKVPEINNSSKQNASKRKLSLDNNTINISTSNNKQSSSKSRTNTNTDSAEKLATSDSNYESLNRGIEKLLQDCRRQSLATTASLAQADSESGPAKKSKQHHDSPGKKKKWDSSKPHKLMKLLASIQAETNGGQELPKKAVDCIYNFLAENSGSPPKQDLLKVISECQRQLLLLPDDKDVNSK